MYESPSQLHHPFLHPLRWDCPPLLPQQPQQRGPSCSSCQALGGEGGPTGVEWTARSIESASIEVQDHLHPALTVLLALTEVVEVMAGEAAIGSCSWGRPESERRCAWRMYVSTVSQKAQYDSCVKAVATKDPSNTKQQTGESYLIR